MSEYNCNEKGAICGISCDAKNCVHHAEDDRCDAHCINVGYKESCSTSETACKTFQAKD